VGVKEKRNKADPTEVQEKLLVKNESEYTSNVKKMYLIKENEKPRDYIVETENSIYIIDATIPIKAVKRRADEDEEDDE
jgi:hypothetical protein